MKYILITSMLIFYILQINYGQTYTRVEYSSADSIIVNPERGWYEYTELDSYSSSPAWLQKSTLQGIRALGYSLINRMVYLNAYKTGDISGAFLSNLNNDFEVLRETGLKVVLRFAYTTNTIPPIGDAPINIVLRHIQQLKPLLQENSDVILTLQAGFIGAWGEWYYTDYYAHPDDSANWSLRAKIVAAEMDALPKNRMVQIRYVPYISKLANDTSVLQPTEAYTGTLKARLAHHNDCFVADVSNEGTYTNITKDRSYLSRDSKYMIVGGETCQVNSPYSDCPNSTNDLATMHWTCLNIDYLTSVYSGWKKQGCFEEVSRNLGYRYRLLYSNIQDTSKEGGVFSINIKLINDGYSNPVNPRKVELILRNKTTKEEYYLNYTQDIRLAKLNDTVTLSFTCGLPMNISEGNYDLLLDMPDPEIRLYDNPLFSIRMANNNIWENTTGYNKLNSVLVIKNNANVPIYNGSQFFSLKKKALINISPNPLKSNVYSNNVLLYWGTNNRKYYQVLERAQVSGQFGTLATLYPGITSYIDKDLQDTIRYKYRIYLTNTDTMSLSDSINVTTGNGNRYFVQIHSDNNIDDWSAIKPVTAIFNSDSTYAIRFFNNTDSIYLLTENIVNAQIFFKTDSFGLQENSFPGYNFEYLISHDSLFNVKNNQWNFVKKINTIKDSNLVKYAIAFTDLPIYNNRTDCLLGVEAPLAILPDTGLALIQKILYPTVPQNFKVTNDTNYPNTSLDLYWNMISNATSYRIERSDGDTTNFKENLEVSESDSRGNGPYQDLQLDSEIIYYYRIYAVNDIYRSGYSKIVSGKPGALSVKNADLETIIVYPNPIKHNQILNIRFPSNGNYNIELINIYGMELYTKETNSNNISINLTSLNLSTGIYFIKIFGNKQTQDTKLIIY